MGSRKFIQSFIAEKKNLIKIENAEFKDLKSLGQEQISSNFSERLGL